MNPNNYCTLEAAQRLQAAGIEIETDCVWCLYDREYVLVETCQVTNPIIARHFDKVKNFFPAPCFTEVWRELRDYGPCTDGNGWWLCDLDGDISHEISDYNPTLAFRDKVKARPVDALIDLLIWVKEKEK